MNYSIIAYEVTFVSLCRRRVLDRCMCASAMAICVPGVVIWRCFAGQRESFSLGREMPSGMSLDGVFGLSWSVRGGCLWLVSLQGELFGGCVSGQLLKFIWGSFNFVGG